MLVGTTMGVMPIRRFESREWTDFTEARRLGAALREDLREGLKRQISACLI
jgi:hypothetical protein